MSTILLATQKLHQILLDVVRAKVTSCVVSTPSSLTSDVEQRILEKQPLLDEIPEKSEELFRNPHVALLSQAESQCSDVKLQTLGDEVSKFFLELANLSARLICIQENFTPQSSRPVEIVNSLPTNSLEEPSRVVEIEESINSRFEEIIRTKPVPAQGNSYGGSTLEEISTRVSSIGYEGRSFTVEIANHLNRPLKNFELYDPFNCAYLNGPDSIAPNTVEVMAFSEPFDFYQHAAFSYSIPNTNVRVAMILKLREGDYFGMKFVDENTSMEYYYRNAMRFPFATNPFFNYVTDRTLIIVESDGTLQARAHVTMSAYHKGFLRIDILDVNGV